MEPDNSATQPRRQPPTTARQPDREVPPNGAVPKGTTGESSTPKDTAPRGGGEDEEDNGDGGGTPPTALDGRPWSLGSRIAIAAVTALVSLAVAMHLVLVFLHVAPPNTVSKGNNELINDYIYPEFEQNWKLFAPNPLQQNVAVHARARVERAGGELITTGWVDLTKQDGDAIKHNPAPSHKDQNTLRRAWDFYNGSHDQKNKPYGDRGRLSEDYLRRIVAHRFGPELNGGRVVKVQVRSVTVSVPAPPWSSEVISTSPHFRAVPWWTVTEEDFR